MTTFQSASSRRLELPPSGGRESTLISQEMLDKVEKELNNRPRSCLKFNSPSEILKDVKKIANLR